MDIAPALHEAIEKDFNRYYKADKTVKRVLDKVDKGTADYVDAYYYATAVGDCASRALTENLTEEALPEGRLWYNIAQRTVRPLLEQVEVMVAEVTDLIQTELNKKAGIGLKAV